MNKEVSGQTHFDEPPPNFDSTNSPVTPVLPDERLEDRSIDERLYSSWLAEIRQLTSTEPEIDLSKRTQLIAHLVEAEGDVGDPGSGDPASTSHIVSLPPNEVKEGPVFLYRFLITSAAIFVVLAALLGYELYLPQSRAELYRSHIVRALSDLEEFNDAYQKILAGIQDGNFEEIAKLAKKAVETVTVFKRTAAEPPPSQPPFTVYSGKPDPRSLRADIHRLLDALDPLAEQVQLRASFLESMARYREQLVMLDSILSSDGLEGGDKTIVFRGVASNLEAIRAGLEGVPVPKGCEALYRRSSEDLSLLISATRLVVPPSPEATPPGSLDRSGDLAKTVSEARSALESIPIEEAVSQSSIAEYLSILDNFYKRYSAGN